MGLHIKSIMYGHVEMCSLDADEAHEIYDQRKQRTTSGGFVPNCNLP